MPPCGRCRRRAGTPADIPGPCSCAGSRSAPGAHRIPAAAVAPRRCRRRWRCTDPASRPGHAGRAHGPALPAGARPVAGNCSCGARHRAGRAGVRHSPRTHRRPGPADHRAAGARAMPPRVAASRGAHRYRARVHRCRPHRRRPARWTGPRAAARHRRNAARRATAHAVRALRWWRTGSACRRRPRRCRPRPGPAGSASPRDASAPARRCRRAAPRACRPCPCAWPCRRAPPTARRGWRRRSPGSPTRVPARRGKAWACPSHRGRSAAVPATRPPPARVRRCAGNPHRRAGRRLRPRGTRCADRRTAAHRPAPRRMPPAHCDTGRRFRPAAPAANGSCDPAAVPARPPRRRQDRCARRRRGNRRSPAWGRRSKTERGRRSPRRTPCRRSPTGARRCPGTRRPRQRGTACATGGRAPHRSAHPAHRPRLRSGRRRSAGGAVA